MVEYSPLLCILFLLELGSALPLEPMPNQIAPCKNAPGLNECMQNNMDNLREVFAVGNEHFEIKPLEPLHIEKFIASEETVAKGMQLSASDVNIYNGTKFTTSNMRCVYSKQCVFDLFFPNLYITGIYNIDGKFAGIPIKSTGPMHASFKNVKATDNLAEFGETNKDGVAYASMANFKLHLKFGEGFVKLDNLFNGDKALGDAVNKEINSKLELITDDLKSFAEEALDREIGTACDHLVRRYTIDQLFPKD